MIQNEIIQTKMIQNEMMQNKITQKYQYTNTKTYAQYIEKGGHEHL